MQLPMSMSRQPLHWLPALLLFALANLAHAAHWNSLDGPFGGQPLALFIDSHGNTWAGTNGSGVFFRAAGSGTWVQRRELPTQSNAKFTEDKQGTIFVSGSSGLYAFAPGANTWTRVSGTNGLPDEAASGLVTDAAGNVYAAMNQSDVYKRAAGQAGWAQAGLGMPPGALPNDLVVDGSGNVWAAIFGIGVYRLAAGTSSWLAVNTALTQLSVTSLAAIGNDLYAGTQFGGVFLLANAANGNTTWVPWTGGDLGASDSVYAFAAGANNIVYAAGLGAVYAAPAGSTAWGRIGAGIDTLGPGFALSYSTADGSLLLGNGSGVYVLPAASPIWQAANDGITAGTIYGMVVAPNGDLYAATLGQGVQRLAAGAATWAEVDRSSSYPVVGSIAIRSDGVVFATPGGAVKKLVDGIWVEAGTTQNAFAHALAVDAADTVWAGLSGSVRKLAPGATAWTSTGTGLPGNKNVSAVAVDGAGMAFAGIYATGIYTLAAGATAWTLNNAGLSDTNVHVLLKGPGGAVLAGTDSGVFRFASGSWQKIGTGDVQFVYSLAADPAGNVYAGTDNQYAWILDAATSTWIQIPLGLGSRSVQSMAFGAGRIYAGTDASRGSPSGVFVLSFSETVIEFYNSILDHYFITAAAPEQQAILGGSAGPGWSMTGSVFSAGGATQVCRFYGSISPGPNSHFYTIDPAECQQLKDIQASTPPSQKRWNFESNDFASAVPANGQCPAGTTSIYRAYNNGFSQGIDSNHRITSSFSAYLQTVARGWVGEGVVMCTPK